MNFDIITEKPLWFTIFCLLLGLGGAILLYYRSNLPGEIHVWLKRLMAFFRFAVLSVIAFLLLSPLIRTLNRTTEKPIIVIAQDNSQSIANASGKDYLKNIYQPELKKLKENLEKEYEVRMVSFGDGVNETQEFSYEDKITNYSVLFDDLNVKFANRNLAGVILASDGIFNEGSSPLYSYTKVKAPVYTIALGDTTSRKDLVLSKVNHNKIAFLGNSFPIEIVLNARQCAGNKTLLTIEKDSMVLISRPIVISGNQFRQTIPLFLEAKEKGIQRYLVKLAEVDNEINVLNNQTSIFIEVAESKQKVLILANSPHPDIAAIKSVLEGSQNYDVRSLLVKNFEGSFNDYNLVILHQFPSNEMKPEILDKIKSTDASVLYILGSQTAVSLFNKMETGVLINDYTNKTNEVQGRTDHNFSLFTLSDALLKNFVNYPPLVTPFGNYKSTANNYVLFYQQIGSVQTTQPLLVFNTGERHKNAILCGEGYWKWRLHEFSEGGNQDITNEILLKAVQYLSVKEIKSPFRILNKNNYAENEPLIFDAELYNESQELINTPDARITIYNEKKVAYPFSLSKTEMAYTLNAGFFPVGNYRYKAEVKIGDKLLTDAGEFSISEIQLEQAESKADHQLLFALAERSGGKMVNVNQLTSLVEILKAREDIKPVIYTQKKLQDLVNLKWVFFLIITFLTAEWFLRKRSGVY